MAISNTRVTQLSGTDFKVVINPFQFSLTYNPATQVGRLRWYSQPSLVVDDVEQNIESGTPDNTDRDWTDMRTTFPAYPGDTDPETGADLTQISWRGVQKLILAGFDRAYEEDHTP